MNTVSKTLYHRYEVFKKDTQETREMIKVDVETCMFYSNDFRVVTNGYQGGDSGHGGFLTFSIAMGDGMVTDVHFNGKSISERGLGTKINLVFRGDWEIRTVLDGLIELGEQLKKLRDHIKAQASEED